MYESKEDLYVRRGCTQKNEKTSIPQFLIDNSVYDCMPKNSYVVSIDRDANIFEAMQLLLEEGYEELLLWDRLSTKWVLLFSLADAIRFMLFAVQSLVQDKQVNFRKNCLRKLSEDHIQKYVGSNMEDEAAEVCTFMEDESIPTLPGDFHVDEAAKAALMTACQSNTVYEFMLEVYDLQNFQLKTVNMDDKLSFVILKMLTEKIHRIIVQEKGSKMFTSILNYKDILLFLLRSVNEQLTNTNEYLLPISMLLEQKKLRESTILETETVWAAFNNMINRSRTFWINVVDKAGRYVSTLFREDFFILLKDWRMELMSFTVREFVGIKHKEYGKSAVPEFRIFKPSETIKEVVEKIVACRRNTLICIDEDGRVEFTIGLSELFSLYIY